MDKITAYIIDFLACFPVSQTNIIHYGQIKEKASETKIVIIPAFTEFEMTFLPEVPFKLIDNTPILYGDSRVEKQNNIVIIYADIIASSFFLLSRYEELLKPRRRDKHGRFCAKDSIVFQQGYGDKPLVDEYGMLLRKWLREAGITIPIEKSGFSKIYLTHDVDTPFHFERFATVCKQYVKNLFHYQYSGSPLKKYLNEKYDEFYTFPKIIDYDNTIKKLMPEIPIEVIYFLITSGSFFNRKYYNFFSEKITRLINMLSLSGANFGLHLSYEAGLKPVKILSDAKRFNGRLKSKQIISRHHYLSWREPEDVVYMEQAGITDDFTLTYADCPGFRVGTCRPYRFINPKTKELTNIIIHPLEIMECSLSHQEYLNLDYEKALLKSKNIINQVHKHNGELVILWHNTEFCDQNYQEKLYKTVLEDINVKRINH